MQFSSMLTYSGKKVEVLKGIQNGYTRVYQPPSFVTEFQIMHTLLPQGKTTTIGPFDGNLLCGQCCTYFNQRRNGFVD